MKTRYWKETDSSEAEWRTYSGGVWAIYMDSHSPNSVEQIEADPMVIECDADGNPLPAEPDKAAPLTLADLEAFEARLWVNLEALRTP